MFQEQIKRIRLATQLSVAKMADKLEMSASTLTSYERGERTPSLVFLTRLYLKMNINLNWFVSGEGEMFITPKFDTVKNELRHEVLQILKDEGIIK